MAYGCADLTLPGNTTLLTVPSVPERNSSALLALLSNATQPSSFNDVWTLKTTPLFLVALLFPLVNFKSLTFFTKFNSFGPCVSRLIHGPLLGGMGRAHDTAQVSSRLHTC